jgi:hypothetical protein
MKSYTLFLFGLLTLAATLLVVVLPGLHATQIGPSGESGQIAIVSPKDKSKVTSGQFVTVVIQARPGVTLAKASAAFFPTDLDLPPVVSAPPYSVKLRVPEDRFGPARIQATAITRDGKRLQASVTVVIDAPVPIQSISVAPDDIFWSRAGESRNLNVTGVFQDGLRRGVTNAATYQSSNPKVAMVDGNGQVRSIAPGTCIITVTFQGLSQVVQIRVGVFEVPGDLNGDGSVDANDSDLLKSAVGQQATGPDDSRDLNKDGKIDAADLQVLIGLCVRSQCGTVDDEIGIAIDIKPEDKSNTINSSSKGTIPVAMLSSATFNTLTGIDIKTVTFGRSGNEHSLRECRGGDDVNKDSLSDLICHFNITQAGFRSSDSFGILKAKTVGGVPLRGSDTVRIVVGEGDDQ